MSEEKSDSADLINENLQSYEEMKQEQADQAAKARQAAYDYRDAGLQYGQNRTLHAPSYQEAHFRYSPRVEHRHTRHSSSRHTPRSSWREYSVAQPEDVFAKGWDGLTFWEQVKRFLGWR